MLNKNKDLLTRTEQIRLHKTTRRSFILNNAFIKHLSDLFKARFSYIYIPTWEENRLEDILKKISTTKEIIKTERDLYTWTSTKGLIKKGEKNELVSNTKDPMKALSFIEKNENPSVFMLKDFHVFFGYNNSQPDPNVIRRLRDLSPVIKNGNSPKNIVFTSPVVCLPIELQKDMTILEFDLPAYEDIMKVLNDIIDQNKDTGKIKFEINDYVKERLVKAAQGLTLQEAENAFARAMAHDGCLNIKDVKVIFEEKQQIIRKTGILEFINTELNMDDVGGLENLKRWLTKRNKSWQDKAKKYSIPAPKGVLITGVPGCGKSLVAKSISSMWQLPLLRLDMGRIFQGIVGSSEENMRKAISTAEAVAPSILWIDEIEKGFSGSGGRGDSGTSARIFGTFLTWMQEKKKPVFVVATANNINALPSEFLRKGRFDEIFFVDIPTQREREAILLVHLVKRLKNKDILGDFKISKNFVEKLASITEGFTGAELEQIVISALFEGFSEERNIRPDDFLKAVKDTIPLSETMKENILSIRSWANLRAVSATSKEDRKDYSDNIEEFETKEDIYQNRGGRTLDI